jgi:hypothetical protein
MKQLIFFILTFLGAILLVSLLSSCNPCKRLIRLCPPSDSISYIESIDTIIITVPETTAGIEVPLSSFGVTEETEDQKIEVVIRNDTLFITSTCKEQEAEIYQLRTELASQKTIIERVEIPTYVTRNSRYHSLSGIIAPVLLLLIAGAAYLKIKKIV